MRQKYEPAKIEIFMFDAVDIVTTSGDGSGGTDEDGGSDGGHDQGAWI